MKPESFTYADRHGVTIHAYRWPAHEPRGIVQISHGIGEHALRYDAFAQALNAAGYTVYADDHRGHGATGLGQYAQDPARLGRPGAGGLLAAEDASCQLTGIARRAHPGLPVIMFAHSWGSLMAQRILNRTPRVWDSLALSGTAYRTLRHMESGELNAQWAGTRADGTPASGFEWLSRDPATDRAFAADPLCFDAKTPKLLGPLDTLRLLGRPRRGLAAEVPILITAGSDDPLSRGDGLERLATAYRARGVQDVELRIYPGARHEILNETNRAEVIEDLISWIDARTRE
ncbi:lysophospholipase [Brevibacterium sp. 50QC2O2]|uniref:lysophospholipase n=1 Tax=Brevibacterium sp. 50QC2O2 TaxID=2968459 RepID=UPI00211C809E|nr:lysophospholipase [Brevibacterium sp. 50QC2O2]MCQ9388108.1 lysophospholipase [Brevibacterium sp. 50QC2O2]